VTSAKLNEIIYEQTSVCATSGAIQHGGNRKGVRLGLAIISLVVPYCKLSPHGYSGFSGLRKPVLLIHY